MGAAKLYQTTEASFRVLKLHSSKLAPVPSLRGICHVHEVSLKYSSVQGRFGEQINKPSCLGVTQHEMIRTCGRTSWVNRGTSS